MKGIHKQRVSTKGQVTIPKGFRDKLHISSGDEVMLVMTDEGVLIKPRSARLVSLRGLFKEEIEITKAISFIEEERKKWRV